MVEHVECSRVFFFWEKCVFFPCVKDPPPGGEEVNEERGKDRFASPSTTVPRTPYPPPPSCPWHVRCIVNASVCGAGNALDHGLV